MINLTDHNGAKIFLAREAIALIKTAGTSQAWHGIRANVKTFDGEWIEVQERPDQIVKLMNGEIVGIVS